MYYAGIDAHWSCLTVAIVHASGALVRERRRVPIGDEEPLLEALEGFRPLKAVVETCPFWPWIHDLLELTVGFHLAHASGVETIAKSDVKTDDIDARRLARLLSAGLVPEVYAEARGAAGSGAESEAPPAARAGPDEASKPDRRTPPRAGAGDRAGGSARGGRQEVARRRVMGVAERGSGPSGLRRQGFHRCEGFRVRGG